jgi:peptidoglycan/xylan/chitin deacetylase (PgdA/CDA1 family)
MRLAAAACALAIVGIVAVFGIVLAQKSTTPDGVAPAGAKGASAGLSTGTASPGTVALASAATRPVTITELAPAPVAAPALPGAAEPAPTQSFAQAPKAPAAPKAAAPAAPAAPAAAPPATPPAAATTTTTSCPGNPNALGIGRTVEIDTTGGPGFGFEHFKSHDFLREGEVVLTFDDGPWPKNTPAVLAALAAHCTKAIFFPIGLHATYEPGILKQVAAAGHAVGSHTWCHQDLSKTKGTCRVNNKTEKVEYDPKDEIEKGISAVRWAVGGPTAPYFRFPALRQPPELIAYLGTRNIAIFSTDMDSFDFKMRKPEEVRKSVMARLKKHGKGIVLLHDFQHATGQAAADLLNDLKAGGYKIVFMKPKEPVKTIASYDEVIAKQMRPAGGGADRPTSSVVRTVD